MNLPPNCHCTADALFKLPALDQLFRPDEQNKGAVGRSQHTVDLVDADVAVLKHSLHFTTDIFPQKFGTLFQKTSSAPDPLST